MVALHAGSGSTRSTKGDAGLSRSVLLAIVAPVSCAMRLTMRN